MFKGALDLTKTDRASTFKNLWPRCAAYQSSNVCLQPVSFINRTLANSKSV